VIGHVLVNTDEIITNDYDSSHQALDLVGNGKTMSDVISLEEGVVELVVSDVTDTDLNASGTASYGNFVKIKHKNGQKTLYAHLKYGSVTVKKGDTVSKGEKLGTMGATGKAYGVHLHFEVRKSDETRENPYEYLWGAKQIRAPDIITIDDALEIQEVTETLAETLIEDDEVKENNQVEETDLISSNSNASENMNEETKKEIIKASKQNVSVSKKENISVKEEENVIVKPKNEKKYLVNDSYEWYSIVDALKEIGIDSSYSYRSLLANKNNIKNYRGTAKQNLTLLKLLKSGQLENV